MKKFLAIAAAIVTCAHAQTTHGDWSIDRLSEEDSIYAATINDSGGLLGKVCSREGCSWIVTASAACNHGKTYPALLSAAVGAGHVTLICSPNKKTAGRFVIQDFDTMEKAVSGGTTVGFALALDSGEFKVARFQTGGWDRASTQLAARAQAIFRKTGEKTL